MNKNCYNLNYIAKIRKNKKSKVKRQKTLPKRLYDLSNRKGRKNGYNFRNNK